MPEPTVTDRDRFRAIAEAITATHWPSDPRPEHEGISLEGEIVKALAQARQEGREEGLREAATEAREVEVHLRDFLDDPHQADGARRVKQRLSGLLDQPAPIGVKE